MTSDATASLSIASALSLAVTTRHPIARKALTITCVAVVVYDQTRGAGQVVWPEHSLLGLQTMEP
jgi:hypothetical protein